MDEARGENPRCGRDALTSGSVRRMIFLRVEAPYRQGNAAVLFAINTLRDPAFAADVAITISSWKKFATFRPQPAGAVSPRQSFDRCAPADPGDFC